MDQPTYISTDLDRPQYLSSSIQSLSEDQKTAYLSYETGPSEVHVLNKEIREEVMVNLACLNEVDRVLMEEALLRVSKRKKENLERILKEFKVYLFRKSIKSGLKRVKRWLKAFIRLQALWRGKVLRDKFLLKNSKEKEETKIPFINLIQKPRENSILLIKETTQNSQDPLSSKLIQLRDSLEIDLNYKSFVTPPKNHQEPPFIHPSLKLKDPPLKKPTQSFMESFLLPYVLLSKEKGKRANNGSFLMKKPTISLDTLIEMEQLDPELIKNANQANFNDFCIKNIVKRTSWGRLIPISKLMSFETSLSDTLIQITSKNEEKTAKRLYSLIKEYCNEKTELKELETAFILLNETFLGSWELKDELFLLIAKEIINNKDEILLMKLFTLLVMATSCFSLSLMLYFPYLNFLLHQIALFTNSPLPEKDAFISYAKIAFIRVVRHFEGAHRLVMLSKRELSSIQNMHQIQIPISLANNWDKSIWVPIESYSTVRECRNIVLKMLNIGVMGWYYGLFLCEKKNGDIEERLLNEDLLLLDILQVCDIEKEEFEMNVHSGKQKGFHDIWFYDYKLVLKLKAYYLGINDMEIDTDGLCMAYAQHQYELLKGGLRVSEFLAIRLGALAFYLNKGPYKESEIAIIDINLMDYVPKSLIKSLSPGIWLEKIGFEYEEIKGMSPYEAMKGYLDFLAPNEMFLAQGFPVYYIKIIEKAVESAKIKAICAVKPKEVLFLEENTRKLINKYDLKQILKFGVNKEVFFLMVTEDGATHFCESKAAESINYLIKAYINISLGRGIDYKEEY